jgi:hypothetical protein
MHISSTSSCYKPPPSSFKTQQEAGTSMFQLARHFNITPFEVFSPIKHAVLCQQQAIDIDSPQHETQTPSQALIQVLDLHSISLCGPQSIDSCPQPRPARHDFSVLPAAEPEKWTELLLLSDR